MLAAPVRLSPKPPCGCLTLPMTEAEFVDMYVKRLEPQWHIFREVWGHSINDPSTRKRIDLVIEHKEMVGGTTFMFGVEFKSPDQLNGTKKITAWLRQAIGYTQCVWGPNKHRLPILVAPLLDDRTSCYDWFAIRLAGQFGIGDIGIKHLYADYGKGASNMMIRVSGERVWSEHDGWRRGVEKMDLTKRMGI